MTRAAVMLAAVASAIAGAVAVGLGTWLAGCPVPYDVLFAVAVVESIGAAIASWLTFTVHDRAARRIRLEEAETAREAADHAARAIPRPFRTLWDHPALLVTWVDEDGIILRQVGGALHQLALPTDGWIGRPMPTDSVVHSILPDVLGGRTVMYEAEWTDGGGVIHQWTGVAAPFGGPSGRTAGALYVALRHPAGEA